MILRNKSLYLFTNVVKNTIAILFSQKLKVQLTVAQLRKKILNYLMSKCFKKCSGYQLSNSILQHLAVDLIWFFLQIGFEKAHNNLNSSPPGTPGFSNFINPRPLKIIDSVSKNGLSVLPRVWGWGQNPKMFLKY